MVCLIVEGVVSVIKGVFDSHGRSLLFNQGVFIICRIKDYVVESTRNHFVNNWLYPICG